MDNLVDDLVALWRELLDDGLRGPDPFTPDSNFFVEGGHSLLGMVLLDRLEQRTGISLRLADLFKDPTPARLAARIEALTAEGAAR